jgi:hypothetical protein
MVILNLALPYFGLIFIGFACGKAKSLPEQGLAWMNFFFTFHFPLCCLESCPRRRLRNSIIRHS